MGVGNNCDFREKSLFISEAVTMDLNRKSYRYVSVSMTYSDLERQGPFSSKSPKSAYVVCMQIPYVRSTRSTIFGMVTHGEGRLAVGHSQILIADHWNVETFIIFLTRVVMQCTQSAILFWPFRPSVRLSVYRSVCPSSVRTVYKRMDFLTRL